MNLCTRRLIAGSIVGGILLPLAAGQALTQGAMRRTPPESVQQAPAAAVPGAPAGAPAAGQSLEAKSPAPLTAAERLRQQAIDAEKRMDLSDAIMRWDFILKLNPAHSEAATRLAILREQVKLLAEIHFRRGVTLFRKKQREDALREFLLVLGYNPDHAEALDYVRNRLKPPDWVYYTTVQGDTMKVVAQKAYQDEQKDFLVAAYNNLSRSAAITPGMVLQLPIIDTDLRKPSVNVPEVLTRGKSMLDQSQFDQAIAAADSILVYDPGNSTAREIINTAYYRQAKELVEQNRQLEALALFKSVDPGYRDVKESVAAIQNNLKGVAEEHYKKGVQFFINEKLDEAIGEWEETLKIDPNHPKAAADVENARQLREKLQQVR